jgi:class 3 adenylate cyclase/predicted ATPase
MDFYTVVDQVLALLRTRKRVTYSAIQRQFELDEAILEDLKTEIFFAHPQARDHEGMGLVWSDEEAWRQDVVPSSSQSSEPLLTREASPVQSDILSRDPYTPEAERRQLTVMFCDLVDSTALSGHLDPEDLREVVRSYQQTSAEVIQRYDGYIAQYLGDGLLVYFGYPHAHEDDAQRAVRAGLGIIASLGDLNTRLTQEHQICLAVRVGVHTGLVVVGEIGGDGRQEQLALGETPNIAARLEGLAAPNTVVISPSTRRLVRGMFDLEDLGVHSLRGIADPMSIDRVQGERALESRFEAVTETGLTPLVGRDEELGLLLRHWTQAKASTGQVVLLCGEPGIGKSRIVQTLGEHLADEPHIRLRYQCSPYYANSAFYPIIMQLERAAQFARYDTPEQKLTKLEDLLAQSTDQVADVVPLFAAMLSIPTGGRYPPLTLNPQRQKTKTIEALVDQLVGLAHQQPVLFLFEDAHWSDPTSLEALDHLIRRVSDVRALVVLTYRPEFTPPWGGSAHVTTHVIGRLTRRQVTAMVAGVTGGKTVPDVVLDQIVAKTDGVPLFVEELTKTVLESGLLVAQEDHYALTGALPTLAIPTTLQDSLMARLDRLAPVKAVAQLGAALGREFAYELLVAVSPLGDAALQDALDQLVSAELLFCQGTPPEATYLFKHALVQDAAYASMLRSTRHQLHTTIAQVLEAHFPQTVEMQPELLAHHYTEAGLTQQAVVYWKRAGTQAVQQSANVEAIAHITTGLALLTQLPETLERAQDELALSVDLGVALTVTKGFAAPEVEHAYARARVLCQQLGDTPQLFPVLYGLWNFYLVRADMHTVSALAEQLWALAQRGDDAVVLMEAHNVQGQTRIMRGDLASARGHIEQVLALYDPQQHNGLALEYGEDPGIACSVFAAWDMWLLGYPALALQQVASMRALAQGLAHPFSMAQILFFGAGAHLFLRDRTMVQTWAARLMELCREQDFMLWLAGSLILHGWALSVQGQHAEGIDQMQRGLADWRATGAEIFSPWYLGLLAEAYGHAGQSEVARSLLDEALTAVGQKGECWCEAELHRLQGELLLSLFSNHHTEAEVCFHTALDVARAQQAKSWELRAAMSQARLWQQQGRQEEARDLLAPIYGWFTEGFDTADLHDARTLLDGLASKPSLSRPACS